MQFYGCVDAVFDCLSLFGRHDLLATSFGIIGAKLKLNGRGRKGEKTRVLLEVALTMWQSCV